MKNSKPISLDNLLNYPDEKFSDVSLEIERVIKKIKPIYIGKSKEENKGLNNDRLGLVENEEDKDWSAWVLVDDTVYVDIDYYRHREWNQMALRLFPKLVDFIENMPLEGIGRVIIMAIDSNKKVTTHIDDQFSHNQEIPEYDRLLNISFGTKKRLYMYDPITKKKDYFVGRINWIDVSDWHGIDPSPQYTYSVRVDAKLNKEFRQTIRDEYGV